MSDCPAFSAEGPSGIADALRSVDCTSNAAVEAAFGRLFGTDGALGQVLTLVLTIYVALLAVNMLTGRSRLSLNLLTPRMLQVGLVLTFVTSWVAYQSVAWNLLVGAPDEIASALIGTKGGATQLFASRLDGLFDVITRSAALAPGGSAGARIALPSKPADLLWAASLLLMLGTVGVLIVARIALAALMALGPIFIVMALFKGTRGLFEGWLKACVMFAITPLFTVLIGGGAIVMMMPMISRLQQVGGEPSLQLSVSVFLSACVYVALMVMAMKAAGALTSGWRLPREQDALHEASVLHNESTLHAAASVDGAQPMGATNDRLRSIVTAMNQTTTMNEPANDVGAAPSRRAAVVAVLGEAGVNAASIDTDSRDPRIRPLGQGFRSPHTALGILALLCVLVVSPTPAHADSRVITRVYNPDQVVRIAGQKGIQTMIEFGADEHIENIALGDGAGWQVTPNKRGSLVFVKPVSPKARTNMTVVTDKHSYLFDLVSARSGDRTLYTLRFLYPNDPKPVGDKPVAPMIVMADPPPPIDLNFNWQPSGTKRLFPERSFDDGKATYLAWPDDTELPAILITGPDGTEGPVNYTVKGKYLVIDGVAPRYILRAGKDRAILTNLRAPVIKPDTSPKQSVERAP